MNKSDFEINFFGSYIHKKFLNEKLETFKENIENIKIYLVIAGTDTSQIPGISAAGIDPKSRRQTALNELEKGNSVRLLRIGDSFIDGLNTL